MIEVPNLKTLYSLPSKPENGEMAKCTNTNKQYSYNAETEEWEIYKPLTKYEYERNIYKQQSEYDDEEYRQLIDYINEVYREDLSYGSIYMLAELLDLHYFSLFRCSDYAEETLGEAVVNSILSLEGKIVAVENNDSELAIWVKKNNKAYKFVFFLFDDAIVEAC